MGGVAVIDIQCQKHAEGYKVGGEEQRGTKQ